MKKMQDDGFTLVELVVTMTMVVLVSGIVMGFVVDQLRNSTVTRTKADLLREAQVGLDLINDNIRLSSNSDENNRWPDTYAPDSANSFSWQSNASTLILATAAQDTAGNVLFADPSKYITNKDNNIYFVKNNTLYRRILADPVSGNRTKTTCPATNSNTSCPADKEILHNVSSFAVEYRDGTDTAVTPTSARSIILRVTLTSHKYSSDISTTYTTRMVFRND